ncbi:MAG: peptide-methionine (S)-S-oxide reductase MsrA [Gemmatimonadales bacterium]|nr:peptide-methionine (S)-S-oxide reductase MsrA [Gemmatimonadales bacterium]
MRLNGWVGATALALAAIGAAGANDGHAIVPARTETAVFAGGCFWGVQAVFAHVKGVISAESGYTGGSARTATYENVSDGTTGHAESVRIVFDPAQVTYAQLLDVFFRVAHDPTQLNRQGPDRGTQYRSAIWYTNAPQRQAAEAAIARLTQSHVHRSPVVTQVAPLSQFHPAEAYHQDYFFRHPDAAYIVNNDAPKVEALHRQYPALWRDTPVLLTARSASR